MFTVIFAAIIMAIRCFTLTTGIYDWVGWPDGFWSFCGFWGYLKKFVEKYFKSFYIFLFLSFKELSLKVYCNKLFLDLKPLSEKALEKVQIRQKVQVYLKLIFEKSFNVNKSFLIQNKSCKKSFNLLKQSINQG